MEEFFIKIYLKASKVRKIGDKRTGHLSTSLAWGSSARLYGKRALALWST